MFKNFQDFANTFLKFSFCMFLFVVGLWLFACAKEALADDIEIAKDQDCTSLFVHDKDIPVLGGGKDWGYSLPKIERIIVDEGVRLYVVFRQSALFSLKDEIPADHVFRAILEVNNGKIKLIGYQNAKVTAPKQMPEKIEW